MLWLTRPFFITQCGKRHVFCIIIFYCTQCLHWDAVLFLSMLFVVVSPFVVKPTDLMDTKKSLGKNLMFLMYLYILLFKLYNILLLIYIVLSVCLRWDAALFLSCGRLKSFCPRCCFHKSGILGFYCCCDSNLLIDIWKNGFSNCDRFYFERKMDIINFYQSHVRILNNFHCLETPCFHFNFWIYSYPI